MKTSRAKKRVQGLTLVEVLVVLAILIIFTAIILPAVFPRRMDMNRAFRVQCINNLKQSGLAVRVWEGDHGDRYPISVFETNGGTMEFTTGPNVWNHFQVISNEFTTPKLLICPADHNRVSATNFVNFNNSNLSYFVGVNATETDPQAFLSGDRNITNGTPIKNGILELTPNQPAGWTGEMHNKVGNIGLADGSVQQLSIAGLRSAESNTGFTTNRLQMPILTL